MAKRLMVLAGMLAVLLAAAVPAFAQQQTTATGVLERIGPAPEGEPGPRYAITDEATATSYELFSVQVDLEPFVGERVTISGVGAAAPPSSPGFFNLLGVTEVTPEAEEPGTTPEQPFDECLALSPTPELCPDPPGTSPPGGPASDRTATLSFELTVNKGEPPANARFFGAIPAEGCISAPLTDPDGDGVYTGSVDVPRFPPGPVPPGAEPVSLPVQIVQANGGAGPCNPTRVLKDFGLVKTDGDKTFEASVNFRRDRGGTTTPEDTTPGPDVGGSGSDSGGSGGTGDGGSVESGDSAGSDGSNIGDASDSSGGSSSGGSGSNGGSDGGFLSNAASGIRGLGLLPSTGGGMVLTTLGAGALLIGGGLLLRRIFR